MSLFPIFYFTLGSFNDDLFSMLKQLLGLVIVQVNATRKPNHVNKDCNLGLQQSGCN